MAMLGVRSELIEEIGAEAPIETDADSQRHDGERGEVEATFETRHESMKHQVVMRGAEEVQWVQCLGALQPGGKDRLHVDDRGGPEPHLEQDHDELSGVTHENVDDGGDYAEAEAEGELQRHEGKP